ncbi:MAG: ribosomal protein S18-alanine N-acetyltransferase [Deltaproteobacteria bacterium]|jgi:ribosomal-protein-alanine N-acetyltransferase|nr:ribosomal protein S18-alanine N-acetyltransferase [Deltaproteobacteria bacterium]
MAETGNSGQDLEFRILGEADLDSVLELERESFSTPWTREQYALLLKAGACKLFGVSLTGQSGQVLAYAAVSMAKAAGELEIYNIAVRSDKRRRGLGKDLLSAIMAAAESLDIRRAVLEVREGNVAAVALYESLGFTQQGKRRDYYTDPREDALVYIKEW